MMATQLNQENKAKELEITNNPSREKCPVCHKELSKTSIYSHLNRIHRVTKRGNPARTITKRNIKQENQDQKEEKQDQEQEDQGVNWGIIGLAIGALALGLMAYLKTKQKQEYNYY